MIEIRVLHSIEDYKLYKPTKKSHDVVIYVMVPEGYLNVPVICGTHGYVSFM